MLKEGLKHVSRLTVSNAQSAIAQGSGDLPVLATPAMLALMENAAMLAVADSLPEGTTTVGGQIASSHLSPTTIGAIVEAKAVLEKVDGKKLHFRITARQDDKLIGEGTHLRFIVDRERFLSRL
ncbi:thioesterase family protein [Hoylesella marshii]|uniref:thioesterase family protein n=1 Tax=Hoylesella marshii TaxID=189722 RepID=UPI0028D13ED5|nr:thioesterase family protein [Hoylesella marshii]